jgi:hypothetical protein
MSCFTISLPKFMIMLVLKEVNRRQAKKSLHTSSLISILVLALTCTGCG